MKRGFTLIEMVVATTLLAIGVVGALTAFSTATRASSVAERIHTATLLARQHFTELELNPSSITGGDSEGDFGSDNPGYRWKQSAEAGTFPNLFKITLTVQWNLNGKPAERVFVTSLRSDQDSISQQNANDLNSINTQSTQSGTQNSTGGASGG